MSISDQMRAPSKRSVTTASVVLVLLAALGWGFTRLLAHARSNTAARGTISEQAAATKPKTAKDSGGIKPAEPGATLVDSDNDGIPDAAELHTFQDRDNFRRWFTAIAETQFYQLSDQWNAEQRDCAGLVRFAMREALRHHDRIWFQKMGPGYETVAPDVAGFDLAAIDDFRPIHDANDATREIVFALAIHPRHLGSFASEKRATGIATGAGQAAK